MISMKSRAAMSGCFISLKGEGWKFLVPHETDNAPVLSFEVGHQELGALVLDLVEPVAVEAAEVVFFVFLGFKKIKRGFTLILSISAPCMRAFLMILSTVGASKLVRKIRRKSYKNPFFSSY